ncbi:MAG: hypothetical protein QW478_07855 [Candidatus Micrarchaeaceae archaeon]
MKNLKEYIKNKINYFNIVYLISIDYLISLFAYLYFSNMRASTVMVLGIYEKILDLFAISLLFTFVLVDLKKSRLKSVLFLPVLFYFSYYLSFNYFMLNFIIILVLIYNVISTVLYFSDIY